MPRSDCPFLACVEGQQDPHRASGCFLSQHICFGGPA